MRVSTGVRKCPFPNLALATLRSDKKSTPRYIQHPGDGALFESCLKVIHLQQIRFDRSGEIDRLQEVGSVSLVIDSSASLVNVKFEFVAPRHLCQKLLMEEEGERREP
jgi:hypothetical protein